MRSAWGIASPNCCPWRETDTDTVGKRIVDSLNQRVGGFFRNTRRQAGVTCSVCCGPSERPLCPKCLEQRSSFGDQLADRIYVLTYARANARPHIDQSAHTVQAYKQIPPALKCGDDMRLMILAATYVHGSCIARVAGAPWAAVTFVPSATRPGPEHPTAELARHVHGHNGSENRFRLDIGPGISDESRRVRDDKFSVPDRFRDTIAGRHALIIEDTWVTGAKIQSAAVAVKQAGAASVTGLCVARWCRYDWPDHRQLLDSCVAPYDAATCPVTGAECP
jgi:hypothetical protein